MVWLHVGVVELYVIYSVNKHRPSARPGPKYPAPDQVLNIHPIVGRYISIHKFVSLGSPKAGESFVYILEVYQ